MLPDNYGTFCGASIITAGVLQDYMGPFQCLFIALVVGVLAADVLRS